MDPIDDQNVVHSSEVSVWPTALRYGVIGGLVLIIFGLLTYLTGIVDMEKIMENGGRSSWWQSVINYGVMIVAIVLAIKSHRSLLNNQITLGRGFLTGFLTSLVMGGLLAINAFIFFGYIAPEMSDAIYEATIEQMEERGQSEEQIEMASGMVKMFMSPGAMAGYAFFGTLVFGAITSLIAGAIMKRD